jgi:hypothetical protein
LPKLMANGTAPKIAAAVVQNWAETWHTPSKYRLVRIGPIRCTAPQRRGLKTALTIERAYVDKGYRGHDTASQVRSVGSSASSSGKLRRRSAIEAVIGRMKTDGHLGRCYRKGPEGDAANVIFTAVGHALRLVLARLSSLLRLILLAHAEPSASRPRANGLLNGRLHKVGAYSALEHSGS